LSIELWDAKRCAAFLGYSYDHFRKVIRYQADAPKPLERPGRERWLSEDWIEWARGRKPKEITRQLRNDPVSH
jgi:hypothetical protein